MSFFKSQMSDPKKPLNKVNEDLNKDIPRKSETPIPNPRPTKKAKLLTLEQFIDFWMQGAKKKNKRKVVNPWFTNKGICFRPVDLKNIYLMYLATVEEK